MSRAIANPSDYTACIVADRKYGCAQLQQRPCVETLNANVRSVQVHEDASVAKNSGQAMAAMVRPSN